MRPFPVFQDAPAIYRETGDRHSEGVVLNNLGGALRKAGHSGEAITALHDGGRSSGRPATGTAKATR